MSAIKYENRFLYNREYASKFDEDVSSGVLPLEAFLPPADTELQEQFTVKMKIKNGDTFNCGFLDLELFTLRNEFTESYFTGFGVIRLSEIVKAISLNFEKYNLVNALSSQGVEGNQFLFEAVDSKHGAIFIKALKDIEMLLNKTKSVYSRFYFRHKSISAVGDYIRAFSEYMESVYQEQLEIDNYDEYADYKEIYVGKLEYHFFSKFEAAETLVEVIEVVQEYNINFNIFLQEIDAYFRAMHSRMFDVELSYPPMALNI